MFEITGDDIAALNDEDLRTLIGLICEAEMRCRGLPSSAVTWGGSQTAKDGGLDVRVDLPAGTPIAGFIPNPQTGVQVKLSDMPRAEILNEMKPGGTLRPVIVELATASGAYIIISATGSTADSALKSRRDAMAEAVKGMPGAAKLVLDFYDRNRVATWVRDHAGLIPWVRARIGKSVPGWRSYGSWSLTPAGVDAAYLTDDAARIKTGDKDDGDGLSATNGINRIRDVLRAPGQVVRLVGLSGVGKTRLVEALFDASIGTGSLDPSLAFYTNVAERPDPQPAGLASDLIAAGRRAILVIDNCPPELHRQLSDIARAAGTTISVITVEYDIREDQPEGTDVFVLETSSPSLIEKLVGNRYPALSQIDAHTIAEFSGGNARVALALAATVGKNETVAGLSDAELFGRLFHQRHDPDASLMAIAQACSLVYSFEGQMISGDGAELPILGGLIGKSADEVHAGVAELKRRDLLQERAEWRAVLPHAIANRLAMLALQNIPAATLNSGLVANTSDRLLRSYSRRLGYLDGSKEARAVVEGWLAPDGLLAEVANLSELGRAMFNNVAPVVPDAVLSAMEAALSGADEATLRKYGHFNRLLRSLAYDAAQFERSLSLLVRFALLPNDGPRESEAAEIVVSLFYIALSGTHAPVEMRLKALEGLLRSPGAAAQRLGVKALEAMLKTDHFSSHYEFEFGARSRDYGYYPATGKDVSDWYEAVLKVAASFALSESPLAEPLRTAIAGEFSGLWINAGRTDDLERLAHAIAGKRFWREGWLGARETRSRDGKGLPPELLARLTALEEFLRPKDLVDKVRGLVLGSKGGHRDFDDFDDVDDDDYSAASARAAAAVENLGKDVAADEASFNALLPELMHGDGKLALFGHALASNAENPRAMWGAIVSQFAATAQPGIVLLCGFLSGLQKRDAAAADTLLDGALEHASLAEWFPVLQAYVAIDQRGLARLHRALELGKAPMSRFYNLAYGQTCDRIPGPDFKALVLAIANRPDGIQVAMQILSMRWHSDRSAKRETAPEVAEAGRALLAAYDFRKDARSTREDHELGVIIRASLAGSEGVMIARRLCRELMAAVARYDVRAHDYDDLMKGLFEVHPADVLDELFSGDDKARAKSVRLLNDLLRFNKSVVDVVPDDVMLGWCERDPQLRYPIAAAVAALFTHSNDHEPHEWTGLAPKLFQNAPEPRLVLKAIVRRLYPMSWSGSLATKLDSRLKLLDQLEIGDVPELRAALDEAKATLKKDIEAQRRRETDEDRARSGRFE
jgi:hypothetical protein